MKIKSDKKYWEDVREEVSKRVEYLRQKNLWWHNSVIGLMEKVNAYSPPNDDEMMIWFLKRKIDSILDELDEYRKTGNRNKEENMYIYFVHMNDINYTLGGLEDFYGFVVKAYTLEEAIEKVNNKVSKFPHDDRRNIKESHILLDKSGVLIFDEDGVSQSIHMVG